MQDYHITDTLSVARDMMRAAKNFFIAATHAAEEYIKMQHEKAEEAKRSHEENPKDLE